jgi:hypothetical protein
MMLGRCVVAAGLAVAFAAAAGLAGCTGGLRTLPTAQQLVGMGAAPSGVDTAALRRGRALVVTECAACHRLYWPAEYSPQQWRALARPMALRSSLGPEQARDVELYLITASRAVRDASTEPPP